jgi:hypothetical protein
MTACELDLCRRRQDLLPVENIELISRYGVGEWRGRSSTSSAAPAGRSRKAKAKKRILEMAGRADQAIAAERAN